MSIIPFTKPSITELEVQYAIATSSAPVIMADTNWIATAAPIVHLGAKPVFVDILPDSWCLPFLCQGHVTTNVARILSSQ